MAVTLLKHYERFAGLSTDVKPANAPMGSTFFEWDTSKLYTLSPAGWVEKKGTIHGDVQLSGSNVEQANGADIALKSALVAGKTSAGKGVPIQVDADGKLQVGGITVESLTATTVGIDQTTPGTTNKVVAELSGSTLQDVEAIPIRVLDSIAYDSARDVIRTGRRIKSPNGILRWKEANNTYPSKPIITVGWDDGYVYEVAYQALRKQTDLTKSDTITAGVEFKNTVYGYPRLMSATNSGIVIVTTKASDEVKGGVYIFDDINDTAPTKTFDNDGAGISFTNFSCNAYYDGKNHFIFIGEYTQRNNVPHKLWASFDGGQTFSVIKETTVVNPEDITANSHWHSVAFDPYMGRIWAAEGDAENKAINWSDDYGATWNRIAGGNQPTLIVPFPDRVVFGRDGGLPGLDEFLRPKLAAEYTESLVLKDALTFRPEHTAPQHYPEVHSLGYGNEKYIHFPGTENSNEGYVYATGDGGESWHCVHAQKQAYFSINRIVGPTHDGKIVAMRGDGNRLMYADKLTWE